MKTNLLKKLACCLAFALMFCGCNDPEITLSDDSRVNETIGPASDDVPGMVNLLWLKLTVAPGISNGSNQAVSYTFTINGAAYTFLPLSFNDMYKFTPATEQWTSDADVHHIGDIFEDEPLVHFTHDTKLYWIDDQRVMKSLDVVTGQRQTLAPFPGTKAIGVMICVVGSKAFCMGGSWGSTYYNQFWQYDINTNQWTDRGTIPGGRRSAGRAFANSGRIYMGFGVASSDDADGRRYLSDWWVINTSTWSRTRLKDFPGTDRAYPEGSAFGDKFILGWGYGDNGANFDDVWEYDINTTNWKTIPKCPGLDSYGQEDVFGIGGRVYVIRGGLKGFWRYNKLPWAIVDQSGVGMSEHVIDTTLPR